MSCAPGFVLCKGVVDPPAPGACPTPDACMPEVDPVTGCPVQCPIQCAEGEVMCEGIRHDHCPAPPICVVTGDLVR